MTAKANQFLIGCGVVNDRIVINQSISGLGEVVGSYPKNCFLEIGIQYGMVFGFILICIFIWITIRKFIQCGSIREKLLLIALIFVGFMPLLVSGSYLNWSMFYALIGFCTRSDTFGGLLLDEQNK